MNTPDAPEVVRTPKRDTAVFALLGAAMLSTVVIPWAPRRRPTPSWELPDSIVVPVLALAACGLFFVAAAIVPRARRALVAVGGTAAAIIGAVLVSDLGRFASHDMRRVSWLAAGTWLALVIGTAGFEMAMHRRPRSRAISRAAFLGWLTILLAFFFLPLDASFDIERTPAGEWARQLDRGYARFESMAILGAWFSAVAVLGLLQCARRIGSDRDLAAKRRFRTSWLAWLLYPVPLIAVALWASTEAPAKLLGNVLNTIALTLGMMLGGALAIRAILQEPWAWRPSKRLVLAGTGVAGLALVVATVVALLGDRRHDAAIVELADELGAAVEGAIRGEPVDPRFLGGYSDLDLRSAGGVIDLPADASPVLIALGHTAGDSVAWAVVQPDTIRWAPRAPTQPLAVAGARLDSFERAGPGFAALLRRANASECLPALDASDAADPAVRALLGDRPTLGAVCPEETDSRSGLATVGDSSGGDQIWGAIDRYVVVFADEAGETSAVGGVLYANTGLAWVGTPEPWDPDRVLLPE